MHKTNVTTEYREQLKGRILETAMNEFMTNGIRQVKMDDIARKLGISKRTLYEIYDNKEDLLMEGIKESEISYDQYMDDFQIKHATSVMDILTESYRYQVEKVRNISPAFLVDLHKYARIVDYLDSVHTARNKKGILFFHRGVEEGYFREDVDYNLVEQITSVAMRHVMEHQLYQLYGMQHILYNVIFLFMRGVCTEKGQAVLEEKLKILR